MEKTKVSTFNTLREIISGIYVQVNQKIKFHEAYCEEHKCTKFRYTCRTLIARSAISRFRYSINPKPMEILRPKHCYYPQTLSLNI